MPDAHGGLINSRTYWTWTGPDGKPASGATPPGGGARPFGIGSEAPASTQYQEQTYADGTKVLSRWEPGQDNWVQESVTVDPQIRQQYKDQTGGGAEEGDLRTAPNGDLIRVKPDNTTVVVAAAPQQDAGKAPTIHTLPDGSQQQWDPVTRQWTPFAAAKAEKKPGGTEPALNLPAARAGQKTDLNLVEQQANAFIAATNADQSLDPATRRARVATYIATVVKPAVDQATREVNEESDRLRRRQEEADRRAEEAARRSDSTAERQTRVAEEAGQLARSRFGYEAGQDAVTNAMGLLKYQTNPRYLDEMTRAINTIGSGGGPVSFSPEAFRLDLPDVNALAAQGAARAQALYEAQRGLPLAPRPDAVGMPGAAPPVATSGPGAIGSSSGATAGLAQVPFTPRPEMAAAGQAPGGAAPVSAAPAATPGVPAGTPSPLQPGWEWLNGPAGVPRSVY